MVVIALIIHTNAIRVETKIDTATMTSESLSDPKAEALTLIIHKYPPSSKLRPVKAIARNDDVVVIHSNRPKRKPSSRKRRPSSSQYRSKIKPSSGSSSNFGGFKDFSSNDYRSGDFRFPPFPTKNFGEPPRASNKYKYRPKPQKTFESYSSLPSKKSRRPSTNYGPPPKFNKYESTYNQEIEDERPTSFDRRPLQTLQQQQSSFPSYSIDTVEPSSSNYYGTNADKYPQPISNFPLESGSSFKSQKTSYGSPVRAQGTSSSSNVNFNPNLGTTAISNVNANSNANYNLISNFPKLPNRYEPNEFSTPTRSNPLAGSSGNPFLNPDYTNYNDVSETQNIQNFQAASNPNFNQDETFSHNQNHNFNPNPNHNLNPNQNHNINQNKKNQNRYKNFNKFNNFDYDFKGQKNSSPDEDDDDDSTNLDYLFSTRRTTTTTTTPAPPPPPPTTKRPRKSGFGKRKRPGKISQAHNLDTDDLRDAFTESSDFHEIALSSDDFINFDSQRQNKRSQNPQYLHEIHSTLKTARNQNSALRSALGEDFQIVSVQKSLEKDPSQVDFFQRKSDNSNDGFVVGGDLRFGSAAAAPVMWNGDFKNFPRNHRFS